MDKVTYDQVFEHGGLFATPGEAVEQIKVLRDEIGVTNFIAWPNFGGMDQELATASMRRFAEQVMPIFR